MAFIFGASRRDQVHLVSALQSLTPTSVAGLAAALSWSERKTERVVRELSQSHGSAVVFDPARRLVAVRHPAPNPHISGGVAAPVATPLPGSLPAPSAPAAPARPTVTAPAPAREPAPALPKSLGGEARCPSCQVPLLPTSSGGAAVCPQCGRLSTRATRTAAPPRPAEPPTSSSVPVPLESGRTVVHSGDRRSQELFAAWVTSRPIPCPRCRTTLRHRGVGEYGCPSCGHRVTFETSVAGIGSSATRPPAAPP